MNAQINYGQKQRGMRLPIALMLLIPLTMLAVSIVKRNNLEEIMAGNQRDSQQALMNAETGLALAGEQLYLLADSMSTTTPTCQKDTINELLAFTNTCLFINLSLAQGNVSVQVIDNWEESEMVDPGFQQPFIDSDNHVIVRSTGTYRGGERIVEAIFEIITSGN